MPVILHASIFVSAFLHDKDVKMWFLDARDSPVADPGFAQGGARNFIRDFADVAKQS